MGIGKTALSVSARVLACLPFCVSAGSIDASGAARAAQASTALIPLDDIRTEYRLDDIHVVDLDGDGAGEILYRRTARCVGANFDCPNELVVMTALGPDDERALSQTPGLSVHWDAQLAAVRDSGYADDAVAQIPGEVERIAVSQRRVTVAFHAQEDSPICRRRPPASTAEPCPASGRHVWTYAWTPGALHRIEESRR